VESAEGGVARRAHNHPDLKSKQDFDAGWSSLVARRAHNPKVAGSNPAPAILFCMFTVYVIRSARGLRYIGYTEDLAKRLDQHNQGLSRFTSRDSDWRMVYKEEHNTRAEAIAHEKWLKSGAGREFLDRVENSKSSGS
jgi:putative endonuclease